MSAKVLRLLFFISSTILLFACKPERLSVIKLNGKQGCINKRGHIIIPAEWDYVCLSPIRYRLIPVEKDSMYGYITRKGTIAIPLRYSDANNFQEGLAAVMIGKKYGFINTKGQTVIPFLYDDIFDGFSNGLCDFQIKDSCGYINHKGEVVIPAQYRICYPFMSRYGQVMTFDHESKLIDKTGKTYAYEEIGESYRLWRPRNSYPGSFEDSNGRGRKNQAGKIIVPAIYLTTCNLREGMYVVEDKNRKCGAYNEKGEMVISPKFDFLNSFYEGKAVFKLDGKWGYVDRKGRIVIAAQFDEAYDFHHGRAYVEIDGKVGFIDRKGRLKIKPIFEPCYWSGFW
ncbi:WG repeat-containing protein [Taibaiella soli]|uniref:WG repeat-containing protein n=1 Tax=Taibaiella soli TaxID=1649169 RepID=A0A2W2BUZ1_9BACT|nr:WG repeat-containing protein [Taibaiella soli]PZF71633.1 hypothetical protein DN068_16305 [Taibaiella soli]